MACDTDGVVKVNEGHWDTPHDTNELVKMINGRNTLRDFSFNTV